jgi:CheY-like chemotaxis protein
VYLQESNINDQIEYLYTFFKPEIEGKGMTLSYKNPLPSSQAIITTDREKVYSVLTNLIKNAIKYSDKGSIEFGYTVKEEFLEFYVKDTGIGVPKNRQEAIFERFIQADISDKMARQGAGLGLAISKAYIEMLGGKIWIESEVENPTTGTEGGSTFRFTLPYKNGTINKTIAKTKNPKPVEANIKGSLKILIAEDDEPSKLLVSIAVRKLNSEILYAKTGKEAVDACHKNPDIDLVLMDIQMPEMNGYDASREIRKFNSEIIIIAQTAYALKGDKEKALEAGCNDYIPKPIDSRELIQKINNLLKKKHSELH